MSRSGPLAIALVALAGTLALADIYVWQDAAGAEHYTNSLEGVPVDRRAEAKLFVRERPRAAPAPEPETASSAIAVPPAAETELLEDRLVRAFAAGIDAAEDVSSGDRAEIVPASIVQTTEVVVESPPRDTIIVGGFVPGFPAVHPAHRPRRRPDEPPNASFIVGPAGPPPIGAAGPPPIDFPQ